MNQHEAPVGTVATLGHPGNNRLIVKITSTPVEHWVYYDDRNKIVPDEDFRAGWDTIDVPEFEPGHGRPDLDMLHQVIANLDEGVEASYVRMLITNHLSTRPDLPGAHDAFKAGFEARARIAGAGASYHGDGDAHRAFLKWMRTRQA
jgi:hypothetical protein